MQVLICGSDGLFDTLTVDEVISLYQSTPPGVDAASRLCEMARSRGVRDDITCVCVHLAQLQKEK